MYFSKLFISENAPFEAVVLQSSQGLPELLFYTKKSYRILQLQFQLQFYKGTHPPYNIQAPYTIHSYTTSTSREFSIQNPILHAEDKELFEYYITDSRNSMHRRQGDLLEIHPCVLQDLPVTFQAFQPQVLTKATPVTPIAPETFHVFPVFPDIPVFPDTPETFRTFQSFMTFQPFQAILQIPHCSSISRDSTPVQHSPIRMHILQFDGFPENSTEYQLSNYKLSTNITFFKEREMLRYRSELTYSPE